MKLHCFGASKLEKEILATFILYFFAALCLEQQCHSFCWHANSSTNKFTANCSSRATLRTGDNNFFPNDGIYAKDSELKVKVLYSSEKYTLFSETTNLITWRVIQLPNVVESVVS